MLVSARWWLKITAIKLYKNATYHKKCKYIRILYPVIEITVYSLPLPENEFKSSCLLTIKDMRTNN